jgi:hypothetical protein
LIIRDDDLSAHARFRNDVDQNIDIGGIVALMGHRGADAQYQFVFVGGILHFAKQVRRVMPIESLCTTGIAA